jgi:hypothetical protein
MHRKIVKSEGYGVGFYRRGLKWIRLYDRDSRLKFLFKHGQTFDVLFRTFGVL